MGVKVKGLGAAIAGLSRKAKQGSIEGQKEIDRQAKKLAVRARDYAPVKHGHLQSAQNIRALKGKSTGIKFQAKVVMGGKPVTIGGKTRNVDAYLAIIHDYRGTMWSELGPRSLQKGPKVGDKFLSRAAEDSRDSIVNAVRLAVKRGSKAT